MPTTISGSTGVSKVQDAAVPQAALASGVAGTGPAFRAVGQAQGVSAAVWTKINFASETFDTDNAFDLSTDKFQPAVAGYYQIDCIFYAGGAGANELAGVGIYKNGVLYSVNGVSMTVTGYTPVAVLSDLVYLNGSTDYLEFYGRCTTSTAFSASTTVAGFLARKA